MWRFDKFKKDAQRQVVVDVCFFSEPFQHGRLNGCATTVSDFLLILTHSSGDLRQTGSRGFRFARCYSCDVSSTGVGLIVRVVYFNLLSAAVFIKGRHSDSSVSVATCPMHLSPSTARIFALTSYTSLAVTSSSLAAPFSAPCSRFIQHLSSHLSKPFQSGLFHFISKPSDKSCLSNVLFPYSVCPRHPH